MSQHRLVLGIYSLSCLLCLAGCGGDGDGSKTNGSAIGTLMDSADIDSSSRVVTATADESAATAENAAAKTETDVVPATTSPVHITPETIVNSETSLERLKSAVANLPIEKLTAIADDVLAKIKAKKSELGDLKGTVDGITSSVLGGLDSAKESAARVVEEGEAIKDKLVVILDQLKVRGVDVSKYFTALKGQ